MFNIRKVERLSDTKYEKPNSSKLESLQMELIGKYCNIETLKVRVRQRET